MHRHTWVSTSTARPAVRVGPFVPARRAHTHRSSVRRVDAIVADPTTRLPS